MIWSAFTTGWHGLISGKSMGAASWTAFFWDGTWPINGPYTILALTEDSGVCTWHLQIACWKLTYPTNYGIIWYGRRVPAVFTCAELSPVGTYLRDGGCDATDALEIEAVP